MKWMITGGAGFIGCHAAARWLGQGHEVVVVDNLSRPGSAENLAWLCAQGLTQFERSDVRDAAAIFDVMARHADTDALLHLAGQVAVTRSVADPRADFEINALGTFNVLEAVRVGAGGRPALLFSSTNKVYGNLEHLRVIELDGRYALADRPLGIDESEPLDFHSPYGCSKGAGDQYVRDYARIFGLRTVTFRQSCIFGTRQFGIEDQGWIAWFCVAATLGKPVTIYGDGKQVRDTLWVGDLVAAYERAFERIDTLRGEVFNLGGGPENTLSLRALVTRLESAFGPLPVRFSDWRPGDQRAFVADIGKAQRLLGWRPTISTEEGIGRLIAWVGEHREAVSRTLSAAAVTAIPEAGATAAASAPLSEPRRTWNLHPKQQASGRPRSRWWWVRGGGAGKAKEPPLELGVKGEASSIASPALGSESPGPATLATTRALEQALAQARSEAEARRVERS
jgi:CDP-paratose 2-epimerase